MPDAISPVPAPPSWQEAPDPIAPFLDLPRIPAVSLSPHSQWLVELERPGLPPLSDLTEPVLPLAGLEIHPQTHSPAREAAFHGMTLRSLGSTTDAIPIVLPPHPRIRNLRWSPDDRYLAFTLTQQQGVELWVLDTATAKARSLTGPILNAIYGTPYQWLTHQEGLLCKVVPPHLGPPPAAPIIPPGPRIEENLGRVAPARTYTHLLQSVHDETLFEYYFSSVLEEVSLSGERRTLAPTALISQATPSPDGQWILITTLHRPFSYQVPLGRFPSRYEILERRTGQVRQTVAETPLADDIPITFDSVRRGRRRIGWRADTPATLVWVEALDDGDAHRPASHRDAVYQWMAPFSQPEQLLWRSELRFSGILWGNDRIALAYETWYDTRQLRVWRLQPGDPAQSPVLLEERDFQDAYGDPGSPVAVAGEFGRSVLLTVPGKDGQGEGIYLNGRGISEAGVYPFLDRLDLKTGLKERLWQSADPFYERVERLLDERGDRFLTRRQSSTSPPNYWLWSQAAGALQALTHHTDPMPWFKRVYRKIIRYQRADGLLLSGTLYLPPQYDPSRDGPLPILLWAYPQEYKSWTTAGQVRTSENTFSRPFKASPLFLLTQGYGVLMGPSMPIVGEAEAEPNDTYVEQLVASAQAAVDYLVQRGVGDRDAIAIGGHSYGAFTTANLLAHSTLFRAGIARSGAYNRTLTPFGFQGEQRTFWEAPQTYIDISPFTQAAQINQPLLLIHGAEDPNAGTYPLQSERLYEAMRGLGKTVRWVELPHEGHSYRARETVNHVLWEMTRWLDHYVKPALGKPA